MQQERPELPGEQEIHCHLWFGDSRPSVRSKHLIESLLDYYDIREQTIEQSKRGKPYLTSTPSHPAMQINAANSMNVGIVVVSRNTEMGCDIERHRTRDFTKISDARFHPNESGQLATATDESSTFYRLWTLKEAHSKALDEPLARSMRADFSSWLSNEVVSLAETPTHVTMHQQDKNTGCVNIALPIPGDVLFSSAIAVCSSIPDWQITLIKH